MISSPLTSFLKENEKIKNNSLEKIFEKIKKEVLDI
jgi:hypothetical protein